MEITLEESNTENIAPLLHEFVKRILKESKTYDSIQKDFLFVMIIVLMIENGFLLVSEDNEVMDPMASFSVVQLSKWKSPSGIYEATFIMSGFKNITLKLIMSPLGATVLVNLVINELNYDTYSICIPISRYVVSPQATSIPMIFRDLKHFSTTFKNKTVSAVKSRILSHHGYASASLMGLPEEVLLNIMINLPVIDIINVCKANTRLKVLLESDSLWYSLCKRDFRTDLPTDGRSWKELYKQNYITEQDKKLRSRNRGAGSMHDYMDYSDYVSYIDNPLWNVII
ncbi:uncharacterized protein LOC118267154 [Spodoptera frugiperda]|uniref:Uncharacterized protein LOC118267154 n=1 Tax=Spodoptera frugiperda TaxID=7108 RepID=A0A9R0EIK8_SPOFR|nr:uncharacterized protein LOC118267154 [Spodoptera frugiperda]